MNGVVVGREGEGKGKGKEREVSKIVFLVDPWQYFHVGRLDLRFKGRMSGAVV